MIDQILLFPYALALRVRHALYDHGRKKSWRSPVPTVCVGNLAAGGTGKTPHTEMIVEELLASDEWGWRNLAVLSRGYKRKSKGFQQVKPDGTAALYGDEPLQVKKKFPVATVALDADRVEGCRFLADPSLLPASKKARRCIDPQLPFAADLIVLDDAFQYRRLRADINVVLVEWSRPLNRDALLPLGHLRDLPGRIKAADIVIVTQCPAYLEDWERIQWLRGIGMQDFRPDTCAGTLGGRTVRAYFSTMNYAPMKPVFPEGDPRYVYSQKLILFSGIAKDTPLRQFLSGKYAVVEKFRFPDHHAYSKGDIGRIASASRRNATAVVVTTEKDSQRVRDLGDKVPAALRTRLFEIPIHADFLTPHEHDHFVQTLLGMLRSVPAAE